MMLLITTEMNVNYSPAGLLQQHYNPSRLSGSPFGIASSPPNDPQHLVRTISCPALASIHPSVIVHPGSCQLKPHVSR